MPVFHTNRTNETTSCVLLHTSNCNLDASCVLRSSHLVTFSTWHEVNGEMYAFLECFVHKVYHIVQGSFSFTMLMNSDGLIFHESLVEEEASQLLAHVPNNPLNTSCFFPCGFITSK